MALVILGLFVPSASWIDILRTSPPHLREQLILGGLIFRISLVLLGVFVFTGARMGWWRPTSVKTTFPKPTWNRGNVILIAILLIATFLRLYRLNQGLWIDEIDTLVSYARAPFGEIVTSYESQNQHFLYTLFAHTFFILFGESAWTLRLPAVLFGVASIWALYLFAREVTDLREALLSAALLAFSYHHVWFSQNARGYSGLLFWTLLASWLFVKGLERQLPRIWLYYAAAVVLGIYTHMNMLFMVASHFAIYLWVLLLRYKQPWRHRWAPLLNGFCLAGLLTFLLHAFPLPQILGPALADRSLVATWKNPLWTLQELVRGFHVGFGKGILTLIAFGVLSAGFLSYLRSQPVVIALLLIPVTLGASVTFALGHPLWPRFFFFAVGFGILIAVRGTMVVGNIIGHLLHWEDSRKTRLGMLITLSMILVSAASLTYAYRPKQDFVRARDFVDRVRKQGDTVVAVGAAGFAYKSYYAPEWETANSLEQLETLRGRSDRTWVLCTLPLHMASYHPDIFSVLKHEFQLVKKFPGSLGGGTIFVYRSDNSFRKSNRMAIHQSI
jgi:4-amino-4-deoxy-L-arabinose transferase-like glycosyltransferase